MSKSFQQLCDSSPRTGFGQACLRCRLQSILNLCTYLVMCADSSANLIRNTHSSKVGSEKSSLIQTHEDQLLAQHDRWNLPQLEMRPNLRKMLSCIRLVWPFEKQIQ
jgi:hypothetical protein